MVKLINLGLKALKMNTACGLAFLTQTFNAVSTVTVAKPIVSTALMAGVMIAVVVVAIAAAVIALRRR